MRWIRCQKTRLPNEILVRLVLIVWLELQWYYYSDTLRHNNQQCNVQITDTYYFTFHPSQILCNFLWCCCCCCCCRCCWVFSVFSHPNSLSQWFSLLLFRRLFTLIILAVRAGRLLLSPLCSRLSILIGQKTLITKQEHSIFNFKKIDWEKERQSREKKKKKMMKIGFCRTARWIGVC